MGDVAAVEPPNCGGGDEKKAEKAEEEERLMENMAVLDFDMLCTTVAMQTHMGKWSKLNDDNDNDEESLMLYPKGGGVFRMWEGELMYDCFDDRLIALQSSCFPCYRFGKNMRRAGYGSCFVQGSVYLILMLLVVTSMLAYVITKRRRFVYLTVAFVLSMGAYLGIYRSLMRKKFNIRDDNSSLDDCVYHLLCPCCSLGQESRTLEMNNVQDGIWHGRGDTVCIGNSSSSAIYTPMPQVMSITDPDPHPQRISKAINGSSNLSS